MVAPPPCIAPGHACFQHALSCADRRETPFRHWLLQNALPPSLSVALNAIHLPKPASDGFEGTREANSAKRFYFNPEAAKRLPPAAETVEIFRDRTTIALLEAVTGQSLTDSHLRIEFCQDLDGFWLMPHRDIAVKLLTLQIYLSDDEALSDCGTDLYDLDDMGHPRRVDRAPYALGHGLMFVPGRDTLHGFDPRPIRGKRLSLIVNYVTDAWRNRHELA